jgi:hypothetical protein
MTTPCAECGRQPDQDLPETLTNVFSHCDECGMDISLGELIDLFDAANTRDDHRARRFREKLFHDAAVALKVTSEALARGRSLS